jgi:hypothetical protein
MAAKVALEKKTGELDKKIIEKASEITVKD